MIRSAMPPLDQVVCRIGATFAADMTDAFVAGDDCSSQLAPGLRAVRPIQWIAALPLRWLPAARPVDWRLPWHDVSNWVRLRGGTDKASGYVFEKSLVSNRDWF
jgi:hypothetical protein